MNMWRGEKLKLITIVCSLCIVLIALVWMSGVGNTLFSQSASGDVGEHRIPLSPKEDSEKLLYDDVYMDEAIQTYTLRSLTESLSRVGRAVGIDCHDRAHVLGRRAYELVGAEAFKQCGIECHSGCRHGATEAFFAEKGTADLVGNMRVLCGEEQDRFNLHQCLHGIGHGLMAWYDYQLYDALEACDLIKEQYHRDSCYSGVFMENIVGGIAGDTEYHRTDFLSDDPHYPCNVVEERYLFQCYFLQTDQMYRIFGALDAIGVACAEAPSEDLQFSCFGSMGRTISGQVRTDQKKAFELCMNIAHEPGRNPCLDGVLANLMWDATQAEDALAFCVLAEGSFFEATCWNNLTVQMSEVIPEKIRPRFCKKLPKKYQEQCIEQKVPAALPLTGEVGKQGLVSQVERTDNAVVRYIGGEYIPSVVHISVGQKVTWINEDETFWPASNLHPTHTAYPGSAIAKCATEESGVLFDACRGMKHGETFSFVFTEQGQWRYHDHITPSATGTVLVSEIQ